MSDKLTIEEPEQRVRELEQIESESNRINNELKEREKHFTVFFHKSSAAMAKDQTAPRTEIFELLGDAEKALRRAQTLTTQLLTFAKGGDNLLRRLFRSGILSRSPLSL